MSSKSIKFTTRTRQQTDRWQNNTHNHNGSARSRAIESGDSQQGRLPACTPRTPYAPMATVACSIRGNVFTDPVSVEAWVGKKDLQILLPTAPYYSQWLIAAHRPHALLPRRSDIGLVPPGIAPPRIAVVLVMLARSVQQHCFEGGTWSLLAILSHGDTCGPWWTPWPGRSMRFEGT